MFRVTTDPRWAYKFCVEDTKTKEFVCMCDNRDVGEEIAAYFNAKKKERQ